MPKVELVEQMLNGEFPAYPDINLPAVDVRDVARMHVAAIDNDDTIGERFAANSGAIYLLDAASALAKAYPEKNMKLRKAPNFLIKLLARFDKRMAQAAGNLGHNADVDASKAERIMGFTYIPTEEALVASANYITGHTP